MTYNNKLKSESSRAISSMLVSVIEACRQGEVDFAEELGLSVETIQNLDRLKADQISSISGNYMRDLSILDVFQIDTTKISRLIERALEETKTFEMIDEFIRRGACKRMMGELFGIRSTQVANRKKLLNLPTIKGRPSVATIKEQEIIYQSWLASIDIADMRERLLHVAVETGISLKKIYREVEIIEEVANNNTYTQACA